MPRLLAIGDIHGCAHELEILLNKLDVQAHDTVVFLGDYIDRGPSSRRVVDLILDLKKRCEVVTLCGNHEAMFLDFLDRPESEGAGLFFLNGGATTVDNYTEEDGSIALPEEHMLFFRNLKMTYEKDGFFFVHAGIPDVPIAELNEEEHGFAMLWSRYPFLNSTFKWEKFIVHGHTPVQQVDWRENRVNLDTGCVYNGTLTAVDVKSKTVVQVGKGAKGETAVEPKYFDFLRISERYSGRLPITAKRATDKESRRYETLNFNQFGVLIRDLVGSIEEALVTGDLIEGMIGDDPNTAVEFVGAVVRTEARGKSILYGVKIDRIKYDGGTSPWVVRPEGPTRPKT